MDYLSKYKKYKVKYKNLRETDIGGVTVLRQFVTMAGREDYIKTQLLNMSEQTRKAVGNISHSVYQLKSIPQAFYTFESWKNEQVLDAYMKNLFHRVLDELGVNLVAPPMVTRARMLSSPDNNRGKGVPLNNAPSQITLVPFFVIKSGKVDEVRRAHLSMVEPTRAEVGCIDYDLYQCIDDPLVMFFYENWSDQESLSKHMNTPNFYRVVRGEVDSNLVIPWTALSMTMITSQSEQ
ncbi:MAG: antibiotic biosynthesis monooxygenase [Hyperionvirus sp.]|uniref:Antibiotic biosynthesis monooxygenase n=1 Tax=Hyperionvirus sp. TaxID=2487770 RepID=A0A3G5AC48_9VIRU|nr:MAG: antibiotic biosynthesis monooxygenase [Hyperionvirus sp.]